MFAGYIATHGDVSESGVIYVRSLIRSTRDGGVDSSVKSRTQRVLWRHHYFLGVGIVKSGACTTETTIIFQWDSVAYE